MMITRHFDSEEFECECCGLDRINIKLVRFLELIRRKIELPVIINSGVRCVSHNKSVGGKPNSAHLRGLAADVQLQDMPMSLYRAKILEAIYDVKYIHDVEHVRLGIYKTFIHIDIDRSLPYRVWVDK